MQIDPLFIEKLSHIGLSDKEAAVYAAVLDMGGGFPTKIAQVAGINRTTAYTILEQLAIQGLVSEIEKSKKIYYEPTSTKHLEQFGKMKIQLAKQRYQKIEQLLPDVQGLLALTQNKARVRYFDGVHGVKKVYEDHLLVSKPYHMMGWSNTAQLTRFFSRQFLNSYVQKKKKLQITSAGIFPDSKEGREYVNEFYLGVKKNIRPEARYVPADVFPFECEITLYAGYKVSFVTFRKDRLVGVIIEDKTIYDMMSMIFQLSWNSATA